MDVSNRVTVLTGANGVGKTTLLESAYTSLSGHPLRPGGLSALIARGSQIATVRTALFYDRGINRLFRLVLTRTGSRLFVDNEPSTKSSLTDARPPLCVFTPQRVELVRGQPGVRRSHFDRLASLLMPGLVDVLRSYREAVLQRTACLSGGHSGALDAWEEQVARLGAELVAARLQLVEALAPLLTYEAEQLGLPHCQLVYAAPEEELAHEGIARALVASRTRDVRLRTTTVGPHRHDILLTIAGQPAKTFASQGEQRTAVLALILAEARLIARWRGSEALLLLDDPLGELDERRRALLAARAGALGQTLMTCTDASSLPSLAKTTDISVVDVSSLGRRFRARETSTLAPSTTDVGANPDEATTAAFLTRHPQ